MKTKISTLALAAALLTGAVNILAPTPANAGVIHDLRQLFHPFDSLRGLGAGVAAASKEAQISKALGAAFSHK